MNNHTLVIILLLVLLVACLPRWEYSREWGYGPGAAVLVALGILIGLVAVGRI